MGYITGFFGEKLVKPTKKVGQLKINMFLAMKSIILQVDFI